MKKKPSFVPTLLHIGLLFFSLLLFLLVKNSALLGTFGFESANFFVILLGPFILLNASLNMADRKQGFSHIITREVGWLLITIGFLSALLFINGLMLTSCSIGAGFWPFIVVLFPAFLLNVSLGCILATLLSSRRLKILLIAVGYLSYYVWIFFSWWQHATFRVLSHASILISSDLIEGGAVSLGVIGFRTSTLLLSLALILIGIYFLNTQNKKMFSTAKRHPVIMFMALLLLSAHIGLDHMSTKAVGKDRAQLMKDYSLLVEKNDIKVFADPQKTSKKDAERVLNETEYYLNKLSKKLGELKREPIIIWLHKTAEAKFLYTGAKNVHFALPRHREIHISGYEVPHVVLGHELAHIILGELTDSLLGYPSSNWLLPNLGLTEGLPVALTRELNIANDLTLMEQAQALYQAGVEVDLAKLFSNNPIYFAMINPEVSYIYSGAAMEFLLSSYQGAELREKITKLAQKGSLSAIYKTQSEQKAFFDSLKSKLKEPVALFAISWAHNNFKASGLITSDCTPKGQKTKKRLNRALLNLDMEEVNEVIELLPKASQPAFYKEAIDKLIKSASYLNALSLIEKALPLAAHDQFEHAALKLKQLQCLASLGNYNKAYPLLRDIDKKLFAPGVRRYLTAMEPLILAMLANEERALSQAAINYFMSDGLAIELIYLTYELGRAQKTTMLTSLGRYLLARFELNVEKRYAEALVSLTSILDSRLLPEDFEREAHLMRIKAFIGLKEEQKARMAFDELTFKPSSADKIWLLEQLDRLAFYRTHP